MIQKEAGIGNALAAVARGTMRGGRAVGSGARIGARGLGRGARGVFNSAGNKGSKAVDILGSSVVDSRGVFNTRAIAGLGLAALAAKTVSDGVVQPIITQSKVRKSEKELLSKFPSLKHEDPETVKDYFNVVKQFSPKAAANPLVAGALVNKMIMFGGVDHKLVQDLTGIEQAASTRENKALDNTGKAGLLSL